MPSYNWPPRSSSGLVTTIDGISGAVTLVAGTNITITDNSPSAGSITIAGTGGGDITLAAFGSTPNANGLSLSSQVLNMQPADATHPGGISVADWNTFNNKQSALTFGNLTDVGTDGITIGSGTGAVIGSGTTISQHVADATHNGYLSSADWSTFNSKQAAGSYITALTGDVTATGPGSVAATVAKIQGTTVSGTTGSTNVVFSSAPTLTNPVVGTQSQGDTSTKAASTAYVDTAIANAIAGVNPAVAVNAATTAAADTSSYAYSNGASGIGATLTGPNNTALTVDGFTFTLVNQRILVKNDTQSPSGAFNGVYYVSALQTAITGVILIRALDYDTPSDMNNTGAIPVINGTVNGTTQWVLTSLITTVGTSPLTFTKFSRNPADYLLVANNLSDVAAKATSFNNVSPVTSTGDLIVGNGSNSNTRLGIGTQYQVLQANATTAAYDAVHLDQAAAVTGVLPNTNTTAVSTNTASKIVTRDSSGNFSAGTISAALTGTASGNTTYTASNHGVVVSSSTNAMTVIAPDSSTTKVLTSGGSSADPSWAAVSGTSFATQTAGTFFSGPQSGSAAAPTFRALQTPVITRYTSSSGTHTLTAGVLYIKVTVVGGGGGGGGSGTAAWGAAGSGGNTTWSTHSGSAILTGTGGGAGGQASGGTGGTTTVVSGTVVIRSTGGNGGGSQYEAATATCQPGGGMGGGSLHGFGGGSGYYGGIGLDGTGSGSGGGGGGGANAGGFYTGSGGGGGGTVTAIFTSPAASYDYSIGAAGTTGTAGTSGFAGGAAQGGTVIVEEFFQ